MLVDAPARRARIRSSFELCNAAALAGYCGDQAQRYARLKLSGLDEAPHQMAVFADPETTQGHGLGRRTMPETIEYSVVAAVHTLALAARAHGIGVGWISILDPTEVTAALDVPGDWRLIAYLCLGYPIADDKTPMLERQGWETRKSTHCFVFRR